MASEGSLKMDWALVQLSVGRGHLTLTSDGARLSVVWSHHTRDEKIVAPLRLAEDFDKFFRWVKRMECAYPEQWIKDDVERLKAFWTLWILG